MLGRRKIFAPVISRTAISFLCILGLCGAMVSQGASETPRLFGFDEFIFDQIFEGAMLRCVQRSAGACWGGRHNFMNAVRRSATCQLQHCRAFSSEVAPHLHEDSIAVAGAS